MRYTFRGDDGKPKTVNIPNETLDRHMRDLGLSVEEAIDLALFDMGIKRSEEAESLTCKAMESGSASAGNVGTRAERSGSKRKDPVKEHLLWSLSDILVRDQDLDMDHDGKALYVDEAHVSEDSKSVIFGYGDDVFELKLTRKRKPKA